VQRRFERRAGGTRGRGPSLDLGQRIENRRQPMRDQRRYGRGISSVQHKNAGIRRKRAHFDALFQPRHEQRFTADRDQSAGYLVGAQAITVRLDDAGHGCAAGQTAADAIVLGDRAQPHSQARDIDIGLAHAGRTMAGGRLSRQSGSMQW